MARIGIIGSEGRMGHALVRAIEAAGHDLAGGVDKGGDVASLADASEVLLDFSAPFALDAHRKLAELLEAEGRQAEALEILKRAVSLQGRVPAGGDSV